MVSSYDELKQIARAQKRQQLALMVLSVMLATSTFVTWKALVTLREANEISRQTVDSRKPASAAKSAARRTGPHPEQASAEPKRPQATTRTVARKHLEDASGTTENKPTADSAPQPTRQALMTRPGRQ